MSITRSLLFGIVAVLLMTLAACGVNAPAGQPTVILPTTLPTVNVPAAIQTASGLPAVVGTAAANTITVQLAAENNSGETGTAVLTEISGKTTVVVTVAGEPSGASQPMHIHDGSCGPTLGGVKFTLTPVSNGVSSTTVDTTIAALKAAKFAINAHKSSSEMGSYVFCGNITQ
ncbi:MAG: hypothetical protein LC737_08650 [Chloroflexi bacterium]|nr:hypothetical protein [Chloroflexota bacterium]